MELATRRLVDIRGGIVHFDLPNGILFKMNPAILLWTYWEDPLTGLILHFDPPNGILFRSQAIWNPVVGCKWKSQLLLIPGGSAPRPRRSAFYWILGGATPPNPPFFKAQLPQNINGHG